MAFHPDAHPAMMSQANVNFAREFQSPMADHGQKRNDVSVRFRNRSFQIPAKLFAREAVVNAQVNTPWLSGVDHRSPKSTAHDAKLTAQGKFSGGETALLGGLSTGSRSADLKNQARSAGLTRPLSLPEGGPRYLPVEPDPVSQIPPWVPFAFFAPEMLYLLGTGLNKTVLKSNRLQNRLNQGESILVAARVFAACDAPAPSTVEVSPTVTVEVAAAASATPFVNESLTATPNPPEIQQPVSVEYPTSFSGGEAAGLYTYSGQAGRDSMTPVLRAYNDRYMAELGRAGYIAGGNIAELYASFDSNGFEMRYYQNEAGQWLFVPYQASHGYFVPTDPNGLPYADIKLPYGEVFDPQGGLINQGNDNFDFKTFQADGVQFFGGWPVFVRTDANGYATTALNMKLGGVEVSIDAVPAAATAMPTEAQPVFTIDSIGLSPEQAAAMELHAGLEQSISLEDGRYKASVTILNSEGNPVVQTVDVNPASMVEDLTTQNLYGDTPVMTTTDGKKLYWIQEHQGWYQVELSADIHKPVFVPFDKMEVATRVVIAEYNQPFSQAALDRWLVKGGLSLSFQHLITSANETGGTKFGYIENRSMLDGDVTKGNSPLEVLNSWFVTTVLGGNEYEFSYIKLLNPQNPLAPKGDEWIALPVATGEEIMGNEADRAKFNELWQQATQPGSRLTVVPIVKAEGNFFKDTNGLITFGTAQPSLAKLLALSGNEFGNLDNPNLDGFTFSYWIDQAYNMVGPTSSSSYGVYFENNNPDYKDNFLPDEVQTIVFPSLVIQR